MARVLISMQDEFLDRIDKVADIENRTRSDLVREALRVYMNKKIVTDKKRAYKHALLLDALLS